MKFFLFILIMLVVTVDAKSQSDFTKGSGVIFQKVPNGFITTLPAAPAKVLGDYYLNNDWRTGSIYLNDNQNIDGVLFRYEAKLNQFELKDGENVKVLHGSRVLFFSWINIATSAEETYVHLRNYAFNGTKFSGFARVVAEGEKFKVFNIIRFSESIPNYNAALDVGSRNTTIKKEDAYILARKGEMIELSKNKRKLIKSISEFTERDVAPFVKEQSLSFRSERDFTALASELNK